jgi:hypothetical protein
MGSLAIVYEMDAPGSSPFANLLGSGGVLDE